MRPAREPCEAIGDVCLEEHSAWTKAITKKINLPLCLVLQEGPSNNKSLMGCCNIEAGLEELLRSLPSWMAPGFNEISSLKIVNL